MHQATIQSNNINIHPSVKFGKNVNIKCDSIELGEFCIIGDNVTIECNSFEADSWLFMHHGVEVGRGGCNSPHSNVKIGKGVGIFDLSTILQSYVESDNLGSFVGSANPTESSQFKSTAFSDTTPHSIHTIDKFCTNEKSVRIFKVIFKTI